jgi:hypothetical protein
LASSEIGSLSSFEETSLRPDVTPSLLSSLNSAKTSSRIQSCDGYQNKRSHLLTCLNCQRISSLEFTWKFKKITALSKKKLTLKYTGITGHFELLVSKSKLPNCMKCHLLPTYTNNSVMKNIENINITSLPVRTT